MSFNKKLTTFFIIFGMFVSLNGAVSNRGAKNITGVKGKRRAAYGPRMKANRNVSRVLRYGDIIAIRDSRNYFLGGSVFIKGVAQPMIKYFVAGKKRNVPIRYRDKIVLIPVGKNISAKLRGVRYKYIILNPTNINDKSIVNPLSVEFRKDFKGKPLTMNKESKLSIVLSGPKRIPKMVRGARLAPKKITKKTVEVVGVLETPAKGVEAVEVLEAPEIEDKEETEALTAATKMFEDAEKKYEALEEKDAEEETESLAAAAKMFKDSEDEYAREEEYARAEKKLRDIEKEVADDTEDLEDSSIEVDADDLSMVVETPCGHRFHKKCITDWLKKHPTCPLCRADLTNAELKEVEIPEGEEAECAICLEAMGSKGLSKN